MKRLHGDAIQTRAALRMRVNHPCWKRRSLTTSLFKRWARAWRN